MKRFSKTILATALATAFALPIVTQAGGTTAGTDVTNTATISYSVGGIAQTDITSNSADFKVDQKIDLTVTGNNSTDLSVTPGSTGNAASVNHLVYTLMNEGNATQDFQIDVSHVAGDNFDADSCKFTVGSSPTEHAIGTAVTIDNLAKDATETITVFCNIQPRPTVGNGDTSTVDVLATALAEDGTALTETAGADTADAVDIVFADATGTATDGASRNAKHSDTQTYIVEVPMLTVTKASAVISDPVNGTSNPKRIPGAIIEYTITIANATGAADARNVTMSDVITEITSGFVSYVGGSASVTGEATDVNATTAGLVSGNTVEATGVDIDAGTTATVTFRVEVQ